MNGSYFYLGCAVWAYKDWVGEFYPAGSKSRDFLRLYCDRLTAVEGNTTFYSMPGPETIQRWAELMPQDFRFCPKLPRSFSHKGLLQPHLETAVNFAETLKPLGDRLGPVFVQLPPSYSPGNLSDLQAFLAAWPRSKFPIALEVRHPDWFQMPHQDQLNQLLRSLEVGRVLLDTRPIYRGIDLTREDPQIASERKKPHVPLQPEVTASFTLVRYISHPRFAANQTYFEEWVPRLKRWLASNTTVYFFAHCPDEAQSPAIAREFYHRLQQAGAALPPLKWDCVASDVTASETQLSLF